MCCDCCSVNQRKAWVYGIGILLIALGTALLIFWSDVAETIVHNDLILKQGSESYINWVQAPIPIYLAFYMFNWTNPEEVRNRKVKPHFVEMGPYVFFEKHLKENITFHDNDTVTYYERKTWFFDPVLSNGTLDDMVTSGHAVSATVADEMRHSNKFIKKIINFILNREGGKLHVTKPVGEWIFDGFQDDLVDFLKLFNTTKIDIPYNKFGWLVDRNNSLTYDGSFTLYTGVKDLTKLGLLSHWNSKNETGFYKTPCGVVNGTTGDLFPPHLDTNGEITIFATDACRFMNLQPNGTLQKYGLTAFQWVGTEETLDSGENFPNQQCFCDPRLEDCPKTGVVECKKCRDNAPIYASFPHFYLSDKSYLNAVDGLKPDAEKHKFILSVEPFTGIPVEVNGRLQINLNMIADKDFDIFRDINEFLMPLFWFDQEAYLSPELARKAKLAINLEDYGRYFGIALISCGGLFFVTGIVLTLTKKWKRTPREDEDILTN